MSGWSQPIAAAGDGQLAGTLVITLSVVLCAHVQNRVVVQAVGLVSPLGLGAWQTFSVLLGGETIADRAATLGPDTDPIDLVRAVGGVAVAQHSATDPAVDLAEWAAREAMTAAGIDPAGLDAVVGASKGAVVAATAAIARRASPGDHRRLMRCSATPTVPADADLAIVLGPHGYLNHHLRKRLGLRSVRSVVAACASSLTALHQARLMLLHPTDDRMPRRVLVISCEAALLPAFLHSYARLGVLPPLRPEAYCGRPLDRARGGFMPCEIGAAVVLEAVSAPEPGQIELVDTAIATEAYDLIRTPPRMNALARVVEQISVNHWIDLLHPHATGTVDYDPIELAAYERAFAKVGRFPTAVYAVKGALGHGLGAAGLVSLVIAYLCAKTNRRPPMPWLESPIDTPLPLTPPGLRLKPNSTHAVFAAGFAGHVAGAVLATR